MNLQVTEKTTNILTKNSSEVKSSFSFSNGKTSGLLNCGTVFQAVAEKNDKSVTVSLLRQVDAENVEVYASEVLHAVGSVSFEDRSATDMVTITFKLAK